MAIQDKKELPLAELKPQNVNARAVESNNQDYLRQPVDRTEAYRRKVEELEQQKPEESYDDNESSDSELIQKRKENDSRAQNGLNDATLELMRMKKADDEEMRAKSKEIIA